MKTLQQGVDTKETVKTIGEKLAAILRSGPQYTSHLDDTYGDISTLISGIIPSPTASAARYEQTCKGFLDDVIRHRAMPISQISGLDGLQAEDHPSSDTGGIFDTLLPLLRERFEWCVDNYSAQADDYLNYQTTQFQTTLRDFLRGIPVGGTKEKAAKSRIADIKREVRSLLTWPRLFNIYKATSFPNEIERIIVLASKKPVAAVWCYCELDAEGEYRKTYNHRLRDGRVYAVRDSWALKEGLMKVGQAGYLDDISQPGQEIGCMCSLQWISSLSNVPAEMLTAKVRAR